MEMCSWMYLCVYSSPYREAASWAFTTLTTASSTAQNLSNEKKEHRRAAVKL